MFCGKCGKEVSSSDQFCPSCGAKIDDNRYSQPTNNASNGYNPINRNNRNDYLINDDGSSIGFALLSFFFPLIGIIMYLVWHNERPLRAKSCLYGFISGIALAVIFFCCIFTSFTNQYNGYSYNSFINLF